MTAATDTAKTNLLMALDSVGQDYDGDLGAALDAYMQNTIDSVSEADHPEALGYYADVAAVARMVARTVRQRADVLVEIGCLDQDEVLAAVMMRVNAAVENEMKLIEAA